jgi:hypothetical protein
MSPLPLGHLVVVPGASFYDWLMFGRVLAAMVWVGGWTVLAILAAQALRQADLASLARFAATIRFIGPRLLAPATILVAGLGVWLLLDSHQWHFSQFWIELAIGLLVAVLVVGAGFQSRAAKATPRFLSSSTRRPLTPPGLVRKLAKSQLRATSRVFYTIAGIFSVHAAGAASLHTRDVAGSNPAAPMGDSGIGARSRTGGESSEVVELAGRRPTLILGLSLAQAWGTTLLSVRDRDGLFFGGVSSVTTRFWGALCAGLHSSENLFGRPGERARTGIDAAPDVHSCNQHGLRGYPPALERTGGSLWTWPGRGCVFRRVSRRRSA